MFAVQHRLTGTTLSSTLSTTQISSSTKLLTDRYLKKPICGDNLLIYYHKHCASRRHTIDNAKSGAQSWGSTTSFPGDNHQTLDFRLWSDH